MDSISIATLTRSNSSSRTSLLFNDPRTEIEIIPNDGSLNRDMESLSVSNPTSKSSGNKLKKRSTSEKKPTDPKPSSSRCLSLPVRSNGCRVCACDELDSSIKTRLVTSMEQSVPQKSGSVVETTTIECFSYRKNFRKGKRLIQERPLSPEPGFSLPDDVLELILVRLPLSSLMAARCVCKKWLVLTTSQQFIQLRSNSLGNTPWLFLLGVMRDESHTGDIHALDISSDRWHCIKSDRLQGRFLYSTLSVGSDLYIVGGCSSAPNSIPNSPLSLKTDKTVLVFSPLTGVWRKAASMRVARSRPVIGVFEITPDCTIFHNRVDRHDQKRQTKARLGLGAVSDVYDDPHQLSLRLSLRDAFDEDDGILSDISKNLNKICTGTMPRLGLIVIGGHGCWEEPLDSGEIYDSLNDKWIDIVGLPADFGLPCTGTVCGRKFYVYTESDKLAAYDLDLGFWVGIQTNRPAPRLREYNPKIISCGIRLFMLCVSWCERDGQVNRREKAVRKVLELEMSTAGNKWTEVSRHPDAPMDWCAAYVADEECIYGLEMFRIFGQVLDFVTACHVGNGDMRWSRVSRKQMAHEVDPLSCTVKSLALLHL
ncbi:F-box/kelch-repeat protein [Rhynchospora pubera]|uniref:F-box/kelch-repeat protein n=1 Tax=Rhynchospora pubera TaxID=906938 RepID=A0AAV8F3P5_9POAL|nr:F-box/kelch-repeat protein [Rhynchospora pubera]